MAATNSTGRKATRPALVVVPAQRHPNLTVGNADELERTLRHLSAALFVISGGGCDMFEEMHPSMQDDYLCMCSDLAKTAHGRAAAMLASKEAANG